MSYSRRLLGSEGALIGFGAWRKWFGLIFVFALKRIFFCVFLSRPQRLAAVKCGGWSQQRTLSLRKCSLLGKTKPWAFVCKGWNLWNKKGSDDRDSDKSKRSHCVIFVDGVNGLCSWSVNECKNYLWCFNINKSFKNKMTLSVAMRMKIVIYSFNRLCKLFFLRRSEVERLL